MKIIYWTGEGPTLTYNFGTLNIDDLNPEQHLHWKMSRWQLIVIGLKFVWAGIMGA